MKGYDKTKPQSYRAIIKRLVRTDSIMRDDSYVRIHYIRYADDFVVGVIGSFTLTKTILGKIQDFVNLNLKLTFNEDKTGITDFSKHDFNFLGFKIKAPLSKKGTKPMETICLNGKNITRRKKTRITIDMDTEKVLEKLASNGFIRKRICHTQHKEIGFRGGFKGNLINLDHPDIIKYYNSVVRGIQNYYSFAKNRSSISRIG